MMILSSCPVNPKGFTTNGWRAVSSDCCGRLFSAPSADSPARDCQRKERMRAEVCNNNSTPPVLVRPLGPFSPIKRIGIYDSPEKGRGAKGRLALYRSFRGGKSPSLAREGDLGGELLK